jgi:hypothetical protein
MMEVAMPTSEQRKLTIDTEKFSVLDIVPPFINVCLKSIAVSAEDFEKIAQIAANYQNDARLIEMVRKGGDASAKIPYLLDARETPESILSSLREAAQPQVEKLRRLPEPLRATIELLLSINAVPHGCEAYAITALLEIDRMQAEIIQTLRGLMAGRKLAQEFNRDNIIALQQLDRDWPHLRRERSSIWTYRPLPEKPQMQYHPLFSDHRLIGVYETCVIVDSPGAQILERFTPPVLQRHIPHSEPVPATGSADWLIRDVGKIGRHFTRALLKIIKDHLNEEQVALKAENRDLITCHAQEALKEFVKNSL